jgi:hypothetical protein
VTEDGRKHLEFTQQVIARMANNSFSLKAWSVTLLAAIFALAADKANTTTLWVAVLPLFVFWILDAYFLGQERLYRALYNKIRTLTDAQWVALGANCYSLTPSDFSLTSEPLIEMMIRPTIAALYGTLLASVIAFALILRCWHI